MNYERDKDRFKALIWAVAVEKRAQAHVDNALLRLMFDQLQECDIDDLERVRKAVCLKTRYFPQAGEWLEAVDQLPPPNVAGLLPPKADEHGQVTYCDACKDTGWILQDRLEGGAPNARPCTCGPTNPARGAGKRKRLAPERSDA